MSEAELTTLINRALDGDESAAEAAFDIAYQELCQLARYRLNPRVRGTTLDTRAVVHESFMRFVKNGRVKMNDRQHFLRYASHVMRSVIVDTVRERATKRRGGELQRVTLPAEISDGPVDGEAEILDVHRAVGELAEHDAQMAQVVEMRYFAGMTEVEIGEALGVTDRTVRRIWQRARIWLADSLDR